jgi:type IV pilus assembly protein PilW
MHSRHQGFTLIELLIAMFLGLLVVGALSAVFVNNSETQRKVERSSRQVENGRYAVQVLSDDIKLAGYFGEFNPNLLTTSGVLSGKTHPWPDPCSTTVADDIEDAIALHIQGYNSSSGLSCLSDVKPGTDIIVVRRASTLPYPCTGTSVTNCAGATSGQLYFQASLCSSNSELRSTDIGDFFALSSSSGLDRTQRDCTTPADIRRLVVRIYYVANNNDAGDGIPTLKRAELDLTNTATPSGWAIVPLVEGIDNLRLEYGIDSNGDGTPDSYPTDPDEGLVIDTDGDPVTPPIACSALTSLDAACFNNWRNVAAVRIHVLARDIDPTPYYSDAKTYTLSGSTYGPYGDSYRRHVFSRVASVKNLVGRRER